MKILIANADRTETLGTALKTSADARAAQRGGEAALPETQTLRLKEAGSEGEFLERFFDHLRKQPGLSDDFEMVARKRLDGRVRLWIQKAVARLTKAQHDRFLARQGLLNELLLTAMELQREHDRREIEELRQRLAALEVSGGKMTGKEPTP